MGNTFAYIVLLGWPLLSFFLYCRYSTLTATFWTVVGGYLILPVKVAIDLPLIPALDKTSVPNLSAIAWCFLVKKQWIPLIPNRGRERVLFVFIFVFLLLTALNNSQPVFDGEKFIKGLTLYDGVALSIALYFDLLPYLLGIAIVRSKHDLYRLAKLFIIAGLIYTPAILFEIRMSPQLHTWIYGFFPHTFNQMVRFDGFRPVVFIGHGLFVAMFMVLVCCMAASFSQMRIRMARIPMLLVLIYLCVVLVLCKSVGAWLLGTMAVLSILFLQPGLKQTLALSIATMVVFYPLLCVLGWFPHDSLVEFATFFGPERAESLAFRFSHESALMAHAQEKLLLGWGGWGRNRLHDSTVDGYWIIRLGTSGVLGYLMIAGLLLSSIWRAGNIVRNSKDIQERRLLSSASILIALIMVDQIPNSSISVVMWFFCGAMTGVRSPLPRAKVSMQGSLSSVSIPKSGRSAEETFADPVLK